MKTLNTKTKLASTIESASLFSRGGILDSYQVLQIFAKSWKYDKGKYEPSMKNKELPMETKEPIWYETRSDANGSYLQLLCVDEDKLTQEQKSSYSRIVEIWQAI